MTPPFPNPNWPTLFAEGAFGANQFYVQQAGGAATDMTGRLYKSWSIRRGKQFELDQVQPGEFHGQWVNKDGYLDPTNSSSPLAPGVVPFRGYTMRAQYPPSINMLDPDAATGGEVTPLAVGADGFVVNVTSPYGSLFSTVSGTAWQGTRVWQLAVGASVTTGFDLIGCPAAGTPPISGLTYTFSIRARCLTAGINPQVRPSVTWFDSTGLIFQRDRGSTFTLTGSVTAGWTTITFTDTMPSSGVFVAANIRLDLVGTTPASPWTFQADGLQWELNPAASSFSIPGINYPIFKGLIERYPQSWDYSGTYGVVTPVCVDVMSLLSQTILQEAFVMDTVATGPQWFFPLNDPSGTTTFTEQAGRTPPAGLYSSAYGAGTLTSGNAVAAASPPAGMFFGTAGPVINVNNPTANQGTVVDLTPAGITGPPSSGGWSRMLAFRTAVTVGNPVMAAATTGNYPAAVGSNSNWYLGIQGGATANAVVSMYTDNGTHTGVLNTGVVVNDNNWHLAVFTVDVTGTTLTLYVDGVQAQTTGAPNVHTSLLTNDSIGGDEYKNSGFVSYGGGSWQGDLALYAQWARELTIFEVGDLYSSWRYADVNNSAGGRYVKITEWAGFQGGINFDIGNTTGMGYANDVLNVDALTALQNVVDTEGGRHFVDSNGFLNFQSRQRYFQQSAYNGGSGAPEWVFGENQGAGEIPYTELAFDFDPTRISNQIQITKVNTNEVFSAGDTTSQTNYGIRNLTRNNQSTDTEEVRGSAFFYLSRYKDPHLRVQSLKINVSGNPALFPSVLAFEIGQYVQINRRDQFGVRPMITQYGFIEQITHTGDDKAGWMVELEVSPAPPVSYSSFTSLRTTLNTSASSGQPTITINALPDAATNPVRSQLTGGQILIISGGGLSETQTIAVGGVQDQLAGYSTATVTFTANLTNTYPSGASVYEAAGTGYDRFAAFDNVLFAY